MNRIIFTFCVIINTLLIYSQDTISIYFGKNKSYIDDVYKKNIKNKLSQFNSVDILQIDGYTDIKGSHEENDILSKNRTEAAFKFISEIQNVNLDKCNKFNHGEVEFPSENYFYDRKTIIIYKGKGIHLSNAIKNSKKGDIIEIDELNFIPGEANLLDKSKPILKELIRIMNENKNLKISIEGHICCFSHDYEKISLKRAQTIYNSLTLNGVNKKRLSVVGYGGTKPKFSIPERNENEMIANRRVEIKIIDK